MDLRRVDCYPDMRPDLSGALFMKRSGIKKRERKAETVAQKIFSKPISFESRFC